MLTSLEPKYEFVNGPAYIIGYHEHAAKGSKLPIYIPSLMTGIERNDTGIVSKVEASSENTIFANENHPNISDTVVETNYITGKVTEDLIVKRANIRLWKRPSDKRYYITHIPREDLMEPGDEVEASSNLGIFKDIELY